MAQEGVDWDLVADFVARLRQALDPERIVLYGSRVRGDWLHHSDYDFIVVSPSFVGVPFVRRASLATKHWPGRERVEVLAYTPEEFQIKAQRIGIVQEALREGVDLIGPDAEPVPGLRADD